MSTREEWKQFLSELVREKLDGENLQITKKSLAVLLKPGPRKLPDLESVNREQISKTLYEVIDNSIEAKSKRRAGLPATRYLHDQDVRVGLSKTACHYLWFC